MSIDRVEQYRRGQSPRKHSEKHRFVALEHRVMDSPAFADLRPTSQALIMVIARQLTKDNNGHLQATFSWCKRYGIGSEHTLQSAIADLIAHGFLYRTRSHGANGVWATYALTWLPIKRSDGLFLAGFVPNAWRDWTMTDGKSSPQKLQEHSCKKCSLTPETPAESAGRQGAETADYEPMLPCSSADADIESWIPAYLERLSARGLAHACPVTIQ